MRENEYFWVIDREEVMSDLDLSLCDDNRLEVVDKGDVPLDSSYSSRGGLRIHIAIIASNCSRNAFSMMACSFFSSLISFPHA